MLKTGWNLRTIGEICSVQTGKKDVNEGEENGQYPFYTCAAKPLKSASYSFDEEAILLPGNGANVGLALMYKGKFEAYQRTYVLSKINADVRFLWYFLKVFWKKNLINKQYGSATNYIRLNDILSFAIPLPPLPIQKQIAALLEKADQIKQKRYDSNKLTEQFLQSVFIEMFGNPVTNPKDWITETINGIVSKDKNSIKAGPFGSSLKKEFYVESGYKIYGQEQVIKDDMSYGDYYITEEKYNELKNYSVRKDDILISLVGTYGKMVIVPEIFHPGIINPRLMKISFDQRKIIPLFFKFLFQNASFQALMKNYSHGGTMDILNIGILKGLKIILPPISLQMKFAELVQKVENLKEKQKISEQELDNLFNSLMQKAFKGDLF